MNQAKQGISTQHGLNLRARSVAEDKLAAWLEGYQGEGYSSPAVVISAAKVRAEAIQQQLWSPSVSIKKREELVAEALFQALLIRTLQHWMNPTSLLEATDGHRYSVNAYRQNHGQSGSTNLSVPGVPNPIRLHDAIPEAIADLRRSKNCTEEHIRKFGEAWGELAEFFPNSYFHEMQFPQAKDYLCQLLRLPSRRTIKARYKKLAIRDVLELDIPTSELMSKTTINERMKRIANLFDWAKEHQAYLGENPFSSNRLRLPEVPRERGRLDSEDLQTLFNSALFADKSYRSGGGGRRSWWWLVVLGLYTGARIGELAQLTLKDVIEVDGVLCLSINEDADKTVKTPAGIRICPVHPALLQLGFSEYVQQLARRGLSHILPYPNANTNDAAQRCSKWFCGSYRPRYLPESWRLKNFVYHSLRHVFVNRAVTELHLDLHMVQALIGHEREGMGETRRYAKGAFKVADLFDVMSQVNYDGVDIECLEGGWQELTRD